MCYRKIYNFQWYKIRYLYTLLYQFDIIKLDTKTTPQGLSTKTYAMRLTTDESSDVI